MHPCDLAGGFSDLEMTWLLCCAGAATDLLIQISKDIAGTEAWLKAVIKVWSTKGG